MTVPATTRRAGPYYGNGVTTVFPFTFKVFAKTDIALTLTDTGGITTALVLDSDYSVTLNADQDSSPGGAITYPISGSPMATGFTLVGVGAVPYDQTTDFVAGGAYRAGTHEKAFDRTVFQIQQLAEAIARALLLPPNAADVDAELPSPQAGYALAWNQTATGLTNLDPQTLATVVAFGTANSDIFTGDGVTTSWTLSDDPGNLNNLDVSIGGISQLPGIDYTWVSGTTFTTTVPVPNGVKMLVRYMQGLPQSGAALPNQSGHAGHVLTTNGLTPSWTALLSTLVTHTPSLTGAVSKSLFDLLSSDAVNVLSFGADPTGVSNSSAAFNAALASGKAAVFVPEGTYLVDGLNFPASGKVIMFGVSKRSSILKKNGNGDMITIPNGYCELRDLFLDGNAAAGFTGRGVVYSSATTPNCEIESCQITNFDGYCVEFAASTAGSGFTMRKCRVYRYDQAQYAIKTANDAGAATPRKFIDCLSSGGNFLDLSGADNTQIIGGAYGGAVGGTAPFKFDANSNKAIFSGVRFFNGGGTVTIKGRDSVFVGCAIAGSLAIGGAEADNIIIDGCVIAGEVVINAGAVRYTVAACQVTVGITDFALSQYGWVDIPLTTYTPQITGSVANPSLGNGTLTGSYRRHRDTYKVNIEFTFGSTSTVGTGYWKFSLPITRNASAPNRSIGVAHVFCAATGVYSVGAVVCPTADPGNVTIYSSQDSAQVGQNHPGVWAAGDRIWLQIDVPIY